jgi:hypothetical protein
MQRHSNDYQQPKQQHGTWNNNNKQARTTTVLPRNSERVVAGDDDEEEGSNTRSVRALRLSSRWRTRVNSRQFFLARNSNSHLVCVFCRLATRSHSFPPLLPATPQRVAVVSLSLSVCPSHVSTTTNSCASIVVGSCVLVVVGSCLLCAIGKKLCCWPIQLPYLPRASSLSLSLSLSLFALTPNTTYDSYILCVCWICWPSYMLVLLLGTDTDACFVWHNAGFTDSEKENTRSSAMRVAEDGSKRSVCRTTSTMPHSPCR